MALKAFAYTENEKLNTGIHDKNIYDYEKKLAAQFVRDHPASSGPGHCPLCNSDKTQPYAVFESVLYMRCDNCWSIYIPVDKETLSAYCNYAPMKNFRATDEFQKSAADKRKSVWEDQLFWIKFRTERFLAPLITLHGVEINGRYKYFTDMLTQSCASLYTCTNLKEPPEQVNVAFYFGSVTFEPDLYETLCNIKSMLLKNGLLFMDSRVSTGFDILTLGNKINNIFPYDHSILPSVEALEIVLDKAGYEILEISTPGALDVQYIVDNSTDMDKSNLFARYLIEKADDTTRSEFQRFLQKNAISSYAQIVARVKP